jgi:hypothetical protein
MVAETTLNSLFTAPAMDDDNDKFEMKNVVSGAYDSHN